jgi:MFS family permease
MASFGAVAPLVMFAVNDVILLAGPAADLVVRRRIHPAYLWGVAAVVLMQALIGPLAFSPPAQTLVRALQGP